MLQILWLFFVFGFGFVFNAALAQPRPKVVFFVLGV